ncbi:hypothetical protein TNCV_3634631 [Trichonephila clavipes]|nr:hypothetical protein TNCV_3634631 [Trichonephila clavipes]
MINRRSSQRTLNKNIPKSDSPICVCEEKFTKIPHNLPQSTQPDNEECSYECWSFIGEPKCSIIHARIPHRFLISNTKTNLDESIKRHSKSLKWIESLQRMVVSSRIGGIKRN